MNPSSLLKKSAVGTAALAMLFATYLVAQNAPGQGPGGPGGAPDANAAGGPGGRGGPGGGFGGGGFGGGGRGGMTPYDHDSREGYTQIFNGVNMDGWDYAPEVWHVEDGAMVAGGIAGVNPGTTFASYRNTELGDFDLYVDVQSDGTNTGIQFRSFRNDITTPEGGPTPEQQDRLAQIGVATRAQSTAVTEARTALSQATFATPTNTAAITNAANALATAELNLALAQSTQFAQVQSSNLRLNATQLASVRSSAAAGNPIVSYAVWNVAGYQADFPAVGNIWEGGRFGGTYNGERINERGNLTTRGNITITDANPAGRDTRVLATLDTNDEEGNDVYKPGEWNTYHIMARGNVLILFLNGKMFSMTIDENPVMSRAKGLIAMQIEGSGPVRFKNIWLKESPVEMGPTPTQ